MIASEEPFTTRPIPPQRPGEMSKFRAIFVRDLSNREPEDRQAGPPIGRNLSMQREIEHLDAIDMQHYERYRKGYWQ